ncbi:hypothetical protein [Microbacterium sp. MM2322]|uniref:hypothetical protein n=1 Tax=Microbacterium sp. MM2322 TaxID=3157631 RepID=UPI0032D58FA6
MTVKEQDAAARTPFAFIDVTVHTFTTWGLFSAAAVIYWGVELSSQSGPPSLTVFISSLTLVTSLALVWVGSPLAWLLGRILQNVSRKWTHLAAFWALGTAASVPILWLGSAFTPYENTSQAVFWILGAAVLSGLCSAAGRAIAFAARRRREKRALIPEPEDVLWDDATRVR